MPALNTLEKIVEDTFQSSADQIRQITGLGEVNLVYKVTVGSAAYLIRLRESHEALREYKKEAWCLSQARKHLLDVPSVLAVNELDHCAYMVESFVDGVNGSCHADRLLVWRMLGDAARRLKEIPVLGFGGDLINEDNGTFSDCFSSTLAKQIHYNLSQLTAADPLIELDVYHQADQPVLKMMLNRLFSIEYQPCLCHGDLSPYNMIISQDGRAYLIDFGCAKVHMAHFNLITAGAQTHAEKTAFIKGYGLSAEDFRKQEPEYALFSLLHHFDTLRWAIDHRPKEDWRPYVIQARQAFAVATQMVVS